MLGTEAAMLQLLWRAQKGDEDALRRVVLYCFNRYKHRLSKLDLPDPALTREDLEMTFFEGCMRAVAIADHRGNPLYHIGQRGMWAVQSELRQIRKQLKGRAFMRHETTVDGDQLTDWTERVEDRTAGDFREVVHDVTEAEEQVRIVANTSLAPRTRQALDLIMSGEAGDPTEVGFNLRLAHVMDVSPQRASQVVADLEAAVRRSTAVDARFAQLRSRVERGEGWTGLTA